MTATQAPRLLYSALSVVVRGAVRRRDAGTQGTLDFLWDGAPLATDTINLSDSGMRAQLAEGLARKTGEPSTELLRALARLEQDVTAELDSAGSADRAPKGEGGDGGDRRGPSQATKLVLYAHAAGAQLFHDPNGDAYASLPVEGHRETWAVKSTGMRRWLARRFYEEEEAAPGAQAVQDALNVLAGQAIFDGPELPVAVRIAGHNGAIYLDLCDPAWRAVEITRDGWRVMESAQLPVQFRRTSGMLPLPQPAGGGSLNELRSFVNVAGDADWRLLVAWLVAAYRDRGPYPLVALHGEQGSAKSTTARVLRALVDPSTTPLRAAPRDARDLMIAATNGWCVALDNLSRVPDWLSDAICRLATGGGFSTRTLYENNEETLFDAQRPALLNGIEELATRADLLDRSIVLALPRIPDDRRRSESAFWQEFDAARPRILGALLSAVAGALRDVAATHLERLPRMADFALFATAAEASLGWPPGSFMEAYGRNRATANDLALDASPIAAAARSFAGEHEPDGWAGTAGDLYAALTARLKLPDGKRLPLGWPANARLLSGELRRIAPNLRAAGTDVEFATPHGRRLIILRGQAQSNVPSVPSVPAFRSGTDFEESGTLTPLSGTLNGPGGTLEPLPAGAVQAQRNAGNAGNAAAHPQSGMGISAAGGWEEV